MKTISKRFLKGGLAVLLAVIMLFSSCITGFAAVVDTAQTGADINCTFFYDNTYTQWSAVQLLVGGSNWSDGYLFTRIKNTDVWYASISYGGATEMAIFNASADWGGEGKSVSSRLQYMDKNSAVKSGFGNMQSSYQILTSPTTATSSTDNFTLTTSYNSSLSGAANFTQSIRVYAAAAGSTSYSANAAAGIAKVSGYQVSSASSSGASSKSASTTASSSSASLAIGRGASVTLQATPSAGYEFVGWYTSTSSTASAVSTSATYTVSKAKAATTYYARFQAAPKYTLTYNANGGSGAPAAVTNIDPGTSVTISNTQPTYTGYNFKGWNTKSDGSGFDVASGASYTVNADTTLYAKWAKVHTITYDANGGTGAPSAGTVEDGNNYTVSSTTPTKANYNFKGWKDANGAIYAAGATITAVSSDMTLTAQWELAGACSPAMANLTLDIDETGTLSATTNNYCTGNKTFTYSIVDGGEYITLSGNKVTPKKPGTAHVMATCDCGETVTCAVTVNKPTLYIDPEQIKLLVGQSMDSAFVTSADAGTPTVTITSDDAAVATVTNGKATAVSAGTTDITASFKFNNYYTDTIKAQVTVSDPKITGAPTETVALEYYADGNADTESTTFTLTSNASDSDVDCPAVTVATDNADVATAEIDANGKVTVTATGTGTANITATFLGAEVTIPVTVTTYDPNVYIYVTDAKGWTNMYAYCWEGGYSTAESIQMIYIGRNESNQRVFALKFDKNKLPDNIIFKSKSDWSGSQTEDLPFDISTYNAWWIGDSNNKNNRWNCPITLPTVSVDPVTVAVSKTAEVTATSDGATHAWSIEDTGKATVTGTTTTATVTGVAAGETEITVRAFIEKPQGWISIASDQSTAYPYISSTATAKVNVTETYYNVAFDAEYTDNGSGFTAGNNGGTVSYTGDASVAHGTSITATATAKDGYRFLGWYDTNKEQVSGDATYTFNAEGNVDLTARFIKQYTVTVNLGDGIELVKVDNKNFAENGTLTVDANATFTAYATPATDYKFKNWTITGATVADNALASITVSNVQSNVTITANAAPVFSASATAHTNYGASGGSVTVSNESAEVGENVTFTAAPATTYYFAGWYTDSTFDTLVSENATYTTGMLDTGLDLHALFVKDIYINGAQLTYDIDSDSYTLENATYSDTFTIKDDHNSNLSGVTVPAQQTGATVSGDATNGYTVDADSVNYYTDTVTYELTSAGNGTYTLALTLVEKPKYKVYLGEKDEENLIGEYAVDAPVEFVDTPAYGKYIKNISSEPAIRDLAADMTTNTITFTMPDEVVIVKPAYGNLATIVFSEKVGLDFAGDNDNGFYLPGSDVEITVSPRGEQVTINNMTANGGTVTNNGDGTFTLTVTPTDGQQIYVDLDVDAQFAMNYGVKSIGDYGTGSNATQYGTVTMAKADGTPVAAGEYVEKTDAITYTAVAGANYIFDGFYSEPTCSILNIITRDSTYTVNPDEDTTVYALFVRKQYIAYNYAAVGTHSEMTYDAKTRSFSILSPSISPTAWFRVTNDNTTTSAWNDNTSYSSYGANFNVTFNMTSYGVEVGWGTQCWALSKASSNVNQPFTFILTIDENKSVDISARAQKSGNTAYLSYGRNDIVPAESTVVGDTTGLTINTTGTSHTAEKYITINANNNYSLSFQTQLTGDTAGDYEIDKFVVYHIDTKSYSIVEPNPMGNNTYSGSVYVDGDVYIVPIFFHTEQYAIDNDLIEIDLYFDATAVNKNTWGPFVGAYAYGTDGTSELFYNGTWPGQMMIPSEDGTSFYTMVTVPSADVENSESLIQGFLFSNYMMNSVPQANAGAFGVYDAQVQTYDYKEPITLYQEGVEVITFTAKNSTDGYHGDSASITNNVANPITATDINLEDYDFEYLYNRDGVTPMDFYTDDITNPKNIKTAGADYYVVTRGDVPYGEYTLTDSNVKLQGSTYGADENFEGEWAVDWYVFDRNGKYITHVLSDALFNEGLENDDAPYLVELLSAEEGQPVSNYKGKTVAISYEAPNKDADNHHQIAYDGQWYGNMLEDLVKGNVIVGLQGDDGKVSIKTDEPDNEAYYGNGYIIDVEGDGTPKGEVEVTMNYGEAHLTATPAEGYRFVGWHTYVQGEYIKISAAPVYNSYINMNTTYYAIFKAIGEDEIVINHMTYDNPDDPYIPSHGGVSNMHVQVYNNASGKLVTEGIVSNSISTAVFEVIPNVTEYRVVITTTPLMGGSFYAWYTDSTDAEGNPTYEEILVEEGMVGSETTVTSEFVYVVEEGAPRIVNIYSDIKRVTSYADIVYKYYNRFGEVRTYTVKDVALTDDECDGYIGNKSNPYCPTFNTQYVVENKAGEQETIYGEDQLAEYVANGYEAVSSYNGIHKWAPSHEVTEAIDEIISWTVTEVNLEIDKSYVVVWADQAPVTFKITALMPDGVTKIAEQEGPYNTLAEGIVAPLTYDDKPFSYWIDNVTGEILSYMLRYNYRIVEDKTIMAVYGADVADWTPVIDSVTYTREFQDASDYVYSDFLITFNSSNGEELDIIKAENPGSVKYGLIMVRDASYLYDGGDEKLYPDHDDIIDAVTNHAGQSSAKITGKSDKIYNAYCYDLTNEDSTNFNRMEYYVRYDNTVEKYRKYTFTAYVYLIVDGVKYISRPENVSIYDEAVKSYLQ